MNSLCRDRSENGLALIGRLKLNVFFMNYLDIERSILYIIFSRIANDALYFCPTFPIELPSV